MNILPIQPLNRQARLQRFITHGKRNLQGGETDPVEYAPTDLLSDWQKPRYALPSLRYLQTREVVEYTIYAFLVFAAEFFAAYQVVHAYVSKEGLDISPVGFIGPALLYLVAAAGAAFQLRRVAMRLALRRQARDQIVTVGYKTTLTPVEAGVMLDVFSSEDEAYAMLYHLQAQGKLEACTFMDGPMLKIIDTAGHFTTDEQIFIGALFGGERELYWEQVKVRMGGAAEVLRHDVYRRLVQQGLVPTLTASGKVIYFIGRTMTIVGGVISLLLFWQFFNPESYVIHYPRYPVETWQLGFVGILFALLVLVPLHAYLSPVLSKSGLEKYREAAGLYMYIESALKGRFTEGKLAQSEMDYYLPYAQAFGLDHTAKRELRRVISVS